MKRILVLFALALTYVTCATAQTAIYGTVSSSNYDVGHVGWQYGSTFGLFHDGWGSPFLRAGVDVRASLLGSGNKSLDSALLGPHIQYHFHPHVLPLKPYFEALGGGAHVRLGQGMNYMDEYGGIFQLAGGLDVTLFSRLDWRVAEYSWGSVVGVGRTIRPSMLSTGLVLRLR
jgi:hypothetical protein